MEIVNQVKRQISSVITKETNELILEDNSPLIDSGIIDSLGILSLLDFIEKAFSIHIPVDELTPENFETPLTISRLIECKLGVHKEA